MMLSAFQNKTFDPSLYANYLLIAYAFFLPLSSHISPILMILISLLLLLSGNLKERFLNVVRDRIVISLILFYIMYIIWLIGSEHIHMALLTIKDYKYILYIVIIPMILEKKIIPHILTAFLGAMLFSEIMSYCMFFNIPVPFISLNIPTYATLNIPFMLSHIQYATVLSISLGILLYFLLSKSLPMGLKLLSTLFFMSASINIFIIGSRIGYLLYFVSITTVIFFLYRNQLKKAFLLIIILASVAYLVAWNFSAIFQQRTNQMIQNIDLITKENYATSLGLRAGYYRYGFEVFKDHFFFGVGTADHFDAVSKIISTQEQNKQNIHTLSEVLNEGHNASLHSEYMDISTQFGIIGLLIFLNIFYQIYIYKQHDKNLKLIQMILIFTLLVESLASGIFITRDIGTIFILLIALTLDIKPRQSILI